MTIFKSILEGLPLAVPVVETSPPNAKDVDLLPGRRAKLSPASGPKQKTEMIL